MRTNHELRFRVTSLWQRPDVARHAHVYAAAAVAWLLIASTAQASETTTGLLAEGTRWQTLYYIVDSGVPGPTVLLTGGLHGNEPAGYRAAEQIRHWPIVKGKLIVVPAANRPGLDVNTRFMPKEPDEQRDLNRDFPRDAETTDDTRGPLAKAIWLLAVQQQPNWVIDLHEGFEFHVSHKPAEGKDKSVGSSVIYFKGDAMDALVERMLATVNATVKNADRRFVPLNRGPVAGSFARACIKHLNAQGMIIETTFKDQPLSTRTRQHRMMVNVVLRHIGVVGEDAVDVMTSPKRDEAIEVALYDAQGTGGSGAAALTRLLDNAPGLIVHHVGPADLRPVVLQQFDAVLFPGGSGSTEAQAIGDEGRQAVRQFVEQGGGYLGICAGAYLCSAHYAWSLHLVDASVLTGARDIEGVGRKQMWYRGESTTVKMELTQEGRELFANVPMNVEVTYHNGPIMTPKHDRDLGPFTPLAYFRSEQVLYPPQKGTMVDTPAIVSAKFGKGRIIAISPHPEATKGLQSMIPASVRWIAHAPRLAEQHPPGSN